MQTLIAADNHWALLAILFASTFLAIFLEQKYQWASKISGAIITLVIAIALVNLGVIPSEAPVFDDFVWGYAVPLAIPLLLLQTDLRRMHREAGRFLAIFLIGAVGTVVGAVLATVLLRGTVEGIPGAAAMMTGSYIGGGVNFIAIADAFHVDQNAIIGAFKLNFSEDELSRVVTAMFTKKKTTLATNLSALGYQDLNDPTEINFYFWSFAAVSSGT